MSSALIFVSLGLLFTQVGEQRPESPLTPEQSLAGFELEPGLRAELVAAEPEIEAPVALAFDERGRMFVAENRGYPRGAKAGEKPLGRIALLEDRNGDGRFERTSTFADELSFPNGVLPWRDGVIVTCAPDILWLRDTNDDGVCDQRETLFTGFSVKGSTQLRTSHPMLGIDGWIYVTNGLSGGSIISARDPNAKPIELGRNDFRFRPDFSGGEACGGRGQFGQSFDDFGRRFVCYNRVHVQHVVLTPDVVARVKGFPITETLQNCPAETEREPLAGHGSGARIYPISANVTTADSHAGTFTAACGVTIVRGHGLPERYHGGVLACDPTANLIHFDQLEPHGATFLAKRIHENSELLRSADGWFRPVFLTEGPEGAVYCCDMYRKTIEHPDYLPEEIRKRTDFESGKERGRIWRIVRTDRSAEQLAAMRKIRPIESARDIVILIRSREGIVRDIAHRKSLEFSDEEMENALDHLFTSRLIASDAAQTLALNILQTRGLLSREKLAEYARYYQPRLREAMISLGGPPLPKDEDDRVRFLSAIELGKLKREDRGDDYAASLAEILYRGADDRWTRIAVWSAIGGVEEATLQAFKERRVLSAKAFEGPREFFREWGRVASSLGGDGVSLMERHAKSFNRRERTDFLLGAGEANSAQQREPLQEAAEKLIAEFNAVTDLAKLSEAERMALTDVLGFTSYETAAPRLEELLAEKHPTAIRSAALKSFARLRDPRAVPIVLAPERFNLYSPALRDEALNVAMSSPEAIAALFDALEVGRLPISAVDPFRRRQLSQSSKPELKARAEKLFGQPAGDRARVYAELKESASLPGNAAAGRDIFRKQCASCHRLDREGFAVGPDLFGVRNQPKEAILMHILVPDHEITQGFTAYRLVTNDGRTFTGLLASETSDRITLRLPQGKEESFPRSEIEEFSAGTTSLMPTGVEKTIEKQGFADLLAYLKGEG